MFVMDVPPDVPPQYAPIVVAEAKQARQENKERTIGVCALIESRPESRESAVNSVDVLGIVSAYLRSSEGVPVSDANFYAAKMTLLEEPKHGVLEMDQEGAWYYVNVPNFSGSDQAAFLVEMGGYKVSVKYFFNVMPNVPGSGEEGSPYDDKRLCPNGMVWKISFDENDPTAPIYTFQHTSQLTSALAGVTQANLTFADLAGSALGETRGNTITLDTNAAGHGWFLDTTP